MSNNNLDKISWELVEFVKDTVKKNVVTATNTGKIDVKQEVLPTLFSLLDASFFEGYNKCHKNFSTKVENAMNESSDKTSTSKKRK